MKLLKGAWGLFGVGLSLQYAYWAVTWGAYGLNLVSSPPQITADWYFLGFGLAAVITMAQALPRFGSNTENTDD